MSFGPSAIDADDVWNLAKERASKNLSGSATDLGTINVVFRLRTAIDFKSLCFGVESSWKLKQIQ